MGTDMSRRVYEVSRITDFIANLIKQEPILNNVSISGEVSNLTYHGSGHVYFDLKDDKAKLGCVMFRQSKKSGLDFPMKEGDLVIADRKSVV